MLPTLLPLCGPLSINTFGAFIALGLALGIICILRDPRQKEIISQDNLISLVSFAVFVGILGARALFIIEEPTAYWRNWWQVWDGGFSLLGAALGAMITIGAYAIHKKIRLLPLLDLLTTYAPLTQAVSRMGCFFAGCCSGIRLPKIINLGSFSIISHPTQLYHAAALMVIFVIMLFARRASSFKDGQTTCLYFILMATERFIIDFWRADRIISLKSSHLSIHQILSIGIVLVAATAFFILQLRKK